MGRLSLLQATLDGRGTWPGMAGCRTGGWKYSLIKMIKMSEGRERPDIPVSTHSSQAVAQCILGAYQSSILYVIAAQRVFKDRDGRT